MFKHLTAFYHRQHNRTKLLIRFLFNWLYWAAAWMFFNWAWGEPKTFFYCVLFGAYMSAFTMIFTVKNLKAGKRWLQHFRQKIIRKKVV